MMFVSALASAFTLLRKKNKKNCSNFTVLRAVVFKPRTLEFPAYINARKFVQ